MWQKRVDEFFESAYCYSYLFMFFGYEMIVAHVFFSACLAINHLLFSVMFETWFHLSFENFHAIFMVLESILHGVLFSIC